MTVSFSRGANRPLLVICLVLLNLSAVGCGSGTGDLSGKVSYQGKPLALGSVLLIGADAKPRSAWIETDGSYRFADVPVGEAKLAVYSPDPAKQAKLGKKDKKRRSSSKRPLPPKPAAPELPTVDGTKWFAIPAEYGDVDHSGLRVTIHRGSITYPIDMK
jgi:hypothetical protein